MPLYCVFGNPINHSKSPQIHSSFGRLTEHTFSYEARLAPVDGFEQSLKEFFNEGGLGCNVTAPFKVEAYQLAEVKHVRAVACGAANTLWLADGKLHADNTDGAGLVRDLSVNLNEVLEGKRLLLLGAGGAARGAAMPLLEAGIESLTIANRTHEKAEALVQNFYTTPFASRIKACRFDDLANRQYDIVINATAAGLTAQSLALPDGTIKTNGLAYDMVYGKNTSFMGWATAQNARIHDGLGMLVEQAAEAFAIWHGFRPSTRETLALLRASINADLLGSSKSNDV